MSAADADDRGLADGAIARVFNDRAELEPAGADQRAGPRRRRRRAVGLVGHRSTPTAAPPTRSTNDTLTDWGGGVAYSDTLVEVALA